MKTALYRRAPEWQKQNRRLAVQLSPLNQIEIVGKKLSPLVVAINCSIKFANNRNTKFATSQLPLWGSTVELISHSGNYQRKYPETNINKNSHLKLNKRNGFETLIPYKAQHLNFWPFKKDNEVSLSFSSI